MSRVEQAGRTIAPHGSWSSPITARRVAAGSLRLGATQRAAGLLCWLEGRPAEGGRQQVVACELASGRSWDLTPPGFNVRTRVHEYGGGSYRVQAGSCFFANFADGVVHQQSLDGGVPRALTEPDGACYADFECTPDGRFLAAVEERPRAQGEPTNRIVLLSLTGGEPIVVEDGHDFVSSPRFSPDGSRLAYIVWDHPDMPWDATRLIVRAIAADGRPGPPRVVAGGAGEAVLQPLWSPSGALAFVSDREGFWNPYLMELDGDRVPRALCPRDAEFARPHWVFGQATLAFAADGRLLCVRSEPDGDRLAWLDPETPGRLEEIPLPGLRAIDELALEGDCAAFLAAGPTQAAAVHSIELASGRLREHRSSLAEALPEAWVSQPEVIEFPTEGGVSAWAFYYAPRNPDFVAPDGALPPLLVKSHGGPTAGTRPVLDPRIQFWTSRGIAVVDVNYGGSTGYGRAYRERLRGQWGVVDVDDCANAARFLVREGRVDGERLAISGGSAGGYTTLCALTFRDVFRAGASHYGIGDLEALVRDTHKFESRYTDGLIGPWPEASALYRERSPIHSPERLGCPVIFFQGLEDKVVPPNQAEAMVAALAAQGIAHAYVPFEGEQHGFRRAENIETALDGELYFYGRVFGFETSTQPAAVEIVPGRGAR